MRTFFVALSFLTRIGKPCLVDDAHVAASLRWYGMVGLLIGGLLTFFTYILQSTQFFSTWVLALSYLGFELWLTRGLHYDAIADLGDAYHATGEKFWSIMYDSRLGAFGAMALFFALTLTLFATHTHIQKASWLPLVLAPTYGRISAVLFACTTRPHPNSTLGSKVCAGKSTMLFIIYTLLSLSCILCVAPSFTAALCLITLNTLCVYILRHKAHNEHGCNGDFFGSVIVLSHTFFLLFS